MQGTREEAVAALFEEAGLPLLDGEAEALALAFSRAGEVGAGKVFRRVSDGLSGRLLSCDAETLGRVSGVSFGFTLFARLCEALNGR